MRAADIIEAPLTWRAAVNPGFGAALSPKRGVAGTFRLYCTDYLGLINLQWLCASSRWFQVAQMQLSIFAAPGVDGFTILFSH